MFHTNIGHRNGHWLPISNITDFVWFHAVVPSKMRPPVREPALPRASCAQESRLTTPSWGKNHARGLGYRLTTGRDYTSIWNYFVEPHVVLFRRSMDFGSFIPFPPLWRTHTPVNGAGEHQLTSETHHVCPTRIKSHGNGCLLPFFKITDFCLIP